MIFARSVRRASGVFLFVHFLAVAGLLLCPAVRAQTEAEQNREAVREIGLDEPVNMLDKVNKTLTDKFNAVRNFLTKPKDPDPTGEYSGDINRQRLVDMDAAERKRKAEECIKKKASTLGDDSNRAFCEEQFLLAEDPRGRPPGQADRPDLELARPAERPVPPEQSTRSDALKELQLKASSNRGSDTFFSDRLRAECSEGQLSSSCSRYLQGADEVAATAATLLASSLAPQLLPFEKNSLIALNSPPLAAAIRERRATDARAREAAAAAPPDPRAQCAASEKTCQTGCLGVVAVGLISMFSGNKSGSGAAGDQAQQCTDRCTQTKASCDQQVAAAEQGKTSATSSTASSGGNCREVMNSLIEPVNNRAAQGRLTPAQDAQQSVWAMQTYMRVANTHPACANDAGARQEIANNLRRDQEKCRALGAPNCDLGRNFIGTTERTETAIQQLFRPTIPASQPQQRVAATGNAGGGIPACTPGAGYDAKTCSCTLNPASAGCAPAPRPSGAAKKHTCGPSRNQECWQ
jgi:hypothetical protein